LEGQKNGHSYGEPQLVDQTWRLRIELYLRPDNSMCFRISLRSRIRPQVLTQSIIEVESGAPRIALANIQRLADEQGKNYGDPHDSQELYRQGNEALNKLFSGWKQEGRDWVNACHLAEAYDKPLATVVIHE
jgi:hypothetical protein